MSDDKEPLLEDHEYDGIRELDNPLPMWWLWTFFFTIIFGFLYWIHYTVGEGRTQNEELAADLAEIQVLQKKNPAPLSSDEELQKLLSNPEAKALGKATYASKCGMCHGDQLQGLVGPNLVDDYWIHSKGEISKVVQSIQTGYPDKGMPPWESQLKHEEILAIAAFVVSQQGTQPPNPKAPQGEKIAR